MNLRCLCNDVVFRKILQTLQSWLSISCMLCKVTTSVLLIISDVKQV